MGKWTKHVRRELTKTHKCLLDILKSLPAVTHNNVDIYIKQYYFHFLRLTIFQNLTPHSMARAVRKQVISCIAGGAADGAASLETLSATAVQIKCPHLSAQKFHL